MRFSPPADTSPASSGAGGARWQFKRGFTLIELLLVIAIVGVMLAVVTTEFAGGIGGTRLQMTAQGVMRMSRYARSMSVLQQQPAYLVFGSNGTLRVITQVTLTNSVEKSAADLAEAQALTTSSTVYDAEGAAAPKTADGHSITQTEAEQAYERVRYKIEYTDTVDSSHYKSTARRKYEHLMDQPLDRVFYKSNGTCRPYKVTIYDTDDPEERVKIEVQVDMLGQAKIIDGHS